MKKIKSATTKWFALFALVALTAATGLAGCGERDEVVAPMNALSTIGIYGVNGVAQEYCTTLFGGQDIDAGTVCVAVNDLGEEEYLEIVYTTTGDWELIEAHLWVGVALADMPQTKKGNPKVGNFPYQSGDISRQTSYTFSVDLAAFGGEASLCGEELLAAAHAVIGIPDGAGGYLQTETAWGNGDRMVDRGNWATYFGVSFSCADEPPADSSETAWAYGCADATCFEDIDPEIQRWGWSNYVAQEGTYYFDLYAGAGQCDIEKGTLVGEVVVEYAYGMATVSYQTCDGYSMTETHLYVGPDPLYQSGDPAENTVAPGQLPYKHEGLDNVQLDTFAPVQVSGPFYVTAHAVVWGDFDASVDCGMRGCGYDPPAVCDQSYLYATENNQPVDGDTEMEVRIWKINATAGTATLVDSQTAPVDGYATGNFNGNAWDSGSNRFYFTEFGRFNYPTNGGPTELYFNDLNGIQVEAGVLTGGVAGATFYDGEYYYIGTRTDDYYKVSFNLDGSVATETKIADVFGNNGSFNQGHTLAFGDIAVGPDGMVYGSATDLLNGATRYAVFFRMNLDGTGYTEITTGGVYGAGSYQIAFGSDGTLYGVNARTPYDLITIDLATGATTEVVTALPVALSDVASGPCLFE